MARKIRYFNNFVKSYVDFHKYMDIVDVRYETVGIIPNAMHKRVRLIITNADRYINGMYYAIDDIEQPYFDEKKQVTMYKMKWKNRRRKPFLDVAFAEKKYPNLKVYLI